VKRVVVVLSLPAAVAIQRGIGDLDQQAHVLRTRMVIGVVAGASSVHGDIRLWLAVDRRDRPFGPHVPPRPDHLDQRVERASIPST